jgi:O-antigen/teichoic acid export membrane protein
LKPTSEPERAAVAAPSVNPIIAEPLTGAAVAATTAGSFLMYVLLKARGLFVVPLYGWLLDPGALGIASLAVSVASLTSFAAQMGLPGGMLVRLPHLPERAQVAAAFAAVLRVVTGTILLGLAAVELVLWLAADTAALRDLRPHAVVIAVLAVGYLLREVTLVLPQLHRQTRFLSAMNLFLEYGGSLAGLALAATGRGAAGLLWGIAAVHIVGVALALPRARALSGGAAAPDFAFVRQALAAGLPLFAMGVAQWASQSVDRFLLAHFHGPATVGVYSLGYSVASAVLAVSAGLNLVFLPVAVNLLYTSPAKLLRFAEESVRLTTLVLGLCFAGALAFSQWAMGRLAGPDYAESGRLLPLMVLSYSLFTLAQLFQWIPMSLGQAGRAVVLAYVAMAAVNLVGDVALIPRWGMDGAVASSIFSYTVAAALLAYVARRALPAMRFRTALGPLALAAAAAAMGGAFPLARTTSFPVALVAVVAFVTAYAVVGRLVGAVTAEDLRRLRGVIRK